LQAPVPLARVGLCLLFFMKARNRAFLVFSAYVLAGLVAEYCWDVSPELSDPRRLGRVRASTLLRPGPAGTAPGPKEALDCDPARFRIANQTEGIADPSLGTYLQSAAPPA
jgi:hypothetical protein